VGSQQNRDGYENYKRPAEAQLPCDFD
jgi:hypothetical protein